MTAKSTTEKRKKWIYRAKEVAKVIESRSVQMWINRCTKFLEEKEKDGLVPTISRFYKGYGLWIYWLRDDLNKGIYKDRKDLRKKYNIIKTIIETGKVETILDRNCSTASFAIALMQNEKEWSKEQGKAQPPSITFSLTKFQLPSPDSTQLPSPQSLVPSPQSQESIIVDCEVIGPQDDGSQPSSGACEADDKGLSPVDNPTNDINSDDYNGEKKKQDPIVDINRVVVQNSENGFIGSSDRGEYTPTCPSSLDNSQPLTKEELQPTIVKDFTDDYDSLPIPMKEKQVPIEDKVPIKKEDIEVQSEIFEKDIFFEEDK